MLIKKTTDHQMDTKIAALLADGLDEGVFPGGAAAVSWGSGVERKTSYAATGIKDICCPQDMVKETTFFDLASLSKALSTTLILYSLIEEKKISLTDKLSDCLGTIIPADKRGITVHQLLSHSSGLLNYRPYFKRFVAQQTAENKERLIQYILAEPLAYQAETDCCYSDLGFILLGEIIEQITGLGLDKNFEKYVTSALKLKNEIFYVSETGNVIDKKKFAATEKCSWRGRVMCAETHDEHCWLLNGVSGHAGLFGNVEGVLKLCVAILDTWKGRGEACPWGGMLRKGVNRQYADQTWCLGFDGPSEKGSSGGRYLSPRSIGHLGYTGTSFWIDPDKELVMVLLTNRVHPTRENRKIRKFRPYFHNRIVEEVHKVS